MGMSSRLGLEIEAGHEADCTKAGYSRQLCNDDVRWHWDEVV